MRMRRRSWVERVSMWWRNNRHRFVPWCMQPRCWRRHAPGAADYCQRCWRLWQAHEYGISNPQDSGIPEADFAWARRVRFWERV